MADNPLIESAGLVDLSARGRIRVTGEDRARLLHAMTTNHVQQMQPGEGLYAFFLNAQGRILADAYILCFADHFLIDTEPETRTSLFEHLDKFIIADDVTLEDITEQTFSLGVEGPKSGEVTRDAGLPAPHHPCSHLEWGESSVAAIEDVRIYGPRPRLEEVIQTLEGAGAVAVSAEQAEAARILKLRPRYGADFTESSLPQETQQMHALHFQKGCYLGQEIVERIRSRGHVNKTLMGFELDGPDVPERRAKVMAGDKEAGEITSAAASANGSVRGLAVIRVPFNKPGEMAAIEGRPAQLMEPALR